MKPQFIILLILLIVVTLLGYWLLWPRYINEYREYERISKSEDLEYTFFVMTTDKTNKNGVYFSRGKPYELVLILKTKNSDSFKLTDMQIQDPNQNVVISRKEGSARYDTEMKEFWISFPDVNIEYKNYIMMLEFVIKKNGLGEHKHLEIPLIRNYQVIRKSKLEIWLDRILSV